MCNNARSARWGQNNPEKRRVGNERWKRENPDRSRVTRARAQRKFVTGWTHEEYTASWVLQNGQCAICYRACSVLDADHNHATGQKRGLLCRACNTTLGQMGEDPDRLRSAADYLEKWNF